MNMFDRANEALRQDLEGYARALQTIVTTLPRARGLCDRVVKETRLAGALLAFWSNAQVGELTQLAFHLTNLWPYREQPFARTVEAALRGVRLLARQSGDPLAAEISACFSNIAQFFDEERALLEECHSLIQPHANSMDMTRKRLNLLVATVDARLAASAEQQAMLEAYLEAVALLRDWEGGVPLEERGVEILARCLEMLERVDQMIGAADQTAPTSVVHL